MEVTEKGKGSWICITPHCKQLASEALSHTGIRGNEKADTAAKAALSLYVTPMKLPASEIFPCVNKLISEEWQQSWDNCVGNKLRFIRPTVGTYLRNTSFCRRNIVIINNYLLVTLAVSPHAFLFVGRRTPA